jgi:probable F420-dependent oxidoreductase
MRVDMGGYAGSVEEAAEGARRAERMGYDGWWAFETKHDPFLGCAVAAERTEQITLGTGIAVAFARNPMTVAVQANDVHALSGGRFLLGLGTQIKPHITRRYSMEWSHPAPRMREFVLAVRAIWEAWATGEPLRFSGDFYTHTLMTPFFDPGPNPHGNPRIMMAAVGPLMTEAAGEVADGVFCHGFCTERYVREVTLPALQRGAAKAGRTLEGFEIAAPSFVVAADTEQEREAGIAAVRGQIGFYGSTPAYRPVLEVHGWGELQSELNALTKRGAWDEVSTLVDDEVLHTFAVVGTPEEAVEEVRRRYGDIATRITIATPEGADPERWQALFARLREPAESGTPAA